MEILKCTDVQISLLSDDYDQGLHCLTFEVNGNTVRVTTSAVFFFFFCFHSKWGKFLNDLLLWEQTLSFKSSPPFSISDNLL